MTKEEISMFCVDQLGEILRIPKDTVDVNTKFARLGLDSAMTVYLLMELEDRLDLELSPETFYGCLTARVYAVPMMVPRRQSARDSSASIMANCKPPVALTSPALSARDDLGARFAGHDLQWLTVDLTPGAPGPIEMPRPQANDITFLQYTSGSTSDPKGVVVIHAMLLANLAMAQQARGTGKH